MNSISLQYEEFIEKRINVNQPQKSTPQRNETDIVRVLAKVKAKVFEDPIIRKKSYKLMAFKTMSYTFPGCERANTDQGRYARFRSPESQTHLKR